MEWEKPVQHGKADTTLTHQLHIRSAQYSTTWCEGCAPPLGPRELSV